MVAAVDLLEQVAERMRDRGLSHAVAAREMGVGTDTLRRHLAGEYVRSDSAAKYRRWLSGVTTTAAASNCTRPELPLVEPTVPAVPRRLVDPDPPQGGWRLVDLFAGCGGLSLGFELTGMFSLTLAADVEPSALTLLGNNHRSGRDPSRVIDLSGFLNEHEIRAWYLDHVARLERDELLAAELESLPVPMSEFKDAVRGLDVWFLRRLAALRDSAAWKAAHRGLDGVVLRQTSVVGFHDRLELPRPATRVPSLGPLPWAGTHAPTHELITPEVDPADLSDRLAMWDSAVAELRAQSEVTGARGQLASSARRIASFLELMSHDVFEEQRQLWARWAVAREALRTHAFADPRTCRMLEAAYAPRRVSVLLGGPPCQGFSRIGRGKIRSLRENGVHVTSDRDVGDTRNRLLEAYVQWVGALAPDAFLFENVRHFQAEVVTPDGTFAATEVLAEAIEALSDHRLRYSVASRVIDASKHGVPQARERFFMVGARNEGESQAAPAVWALDLPLRDPVPLKVALDGLGEAVGGGGNSLRGTVTARRPAATGAAGDRYADWIAAEIPSAVGLEPGMTDGHVARVPRADDAAWFSRMGPGTRWMDYRCDDTPTLALLEEAVALLEEAVIYARADPEARDTRLGQLDDAWLREIRDRIGGSLSVRLLLERIDPEPGAQGHHLLTPTYLAKRDGNHGDWLSRLHPGRPCKTIVSHMAKDTYAYVHPWEDRTLSVREAARVQTFPDWFSFANTSLVDAFRSVGNAVPPLLAAELAERVAQVLTLVAHPVELADRTAA